MKHYLLFTLLFLCSYGFAQTDDDTVYYLNRTLKLFKYDFNADPPGLSDQSIVAEKGWRFTIDQPDDTGYVIKFLEWEGGDANEKNQTIYASRTSMNTLDTEGKTVTVTKQTVNYYHILEGDFKRYAVKYVEDNPKLSFVTGAITVPIKIRPAGSKEDAAGNKLRPSDFTGDINIGISVGARIRLDKKGRGFLIPAAGLNLTSVSIDESTVRNGLISAKTNASSLTPFVGVIGEYDKFQLALITGWDRLSGKVGENWIYQGKPWFGVGLGYNIFNTKERSPENNEGD